MTVTEILDKYLEFLWIAFEYDMNVMSESWMYTWVLVPAVGYSIFMIFKWTFIFLPLSLLWGRIWEPLTGKKGLLSLLFAQSRKMANKIKYG